jgi:hypothetical protein
LNPSSQLLEEIHPSFDLDPGSSSKEEQLRRRIPPATDTKDLTGARSRKGWI